jgi:hypothetical protein
VTAWRHATEVDQYSKLRPSDVDTLLIGGDLDFATPAEFATKELMPTLRHGHQVVLHNIGHTDDIWTYETAASSRLINTFFDTGRVDDSGYQQRRMSFDVTPGQPWLARIVVAATGAVDTTFNARLDGHHRRYQRSEHHHRHPWCRRDRRARRQRRDPRPFRQ